MIAFFVVGLGAVVAAVGTGVLVARSTHRPRVYLVAWAVALFGLTVGLGANTIGYLHGYSDLIFRSMELGTALIATLPLCVALVEMLGRSLPARFGMRLAASAIFAIALVILGTDPISSDVTFGKRWPDPASFYQVIPLAVLGFLALFTAVTAVASLVLATLRSSRGQLSRSESGPVMLVAAGAFVVVLPELAWLAQKSVGLAPPLQAKDIFAASCTLAACLAAYAVRLVGRRDLGPAPSGAAVRDDRDGDWDEEPREPSSWPVDAEYYPDDIDEYHDRQPVGGHAYQDARSDFRYPGLAALIGDTADPNGESPEFGDDSAESGWHDRFGDARGQLDGAGPPYSEQLRSDTHDGDPQGQLFGQITIYTLAEGRADDFDRLTEWVMTLVRAKEPNTLVYIVHAVPTAPGQRILYEVYRDRAAHDEHKRRSYVQSYESEQRQFVVASNVIELGLQQAKVSPLPSISAISDILSESGIDLTGITTSSRPEQVPQPQTYRSPREYDQPSLEYDPQRNHQEYDPPYQGWAGIRGEDSRH
jgi:quinol monooxygenase YgiN